VQRPIDLSYLNHAPELSSRRAELATAASVPSVIGSNSAISVQWTPAVVVNNGSATDGPVIRRCRFGLLWADQEPGSSGDKSKADLHEYLSFPRDFVSDSAPRGQRWILTAGRKTKTKTRVFATYGTGEDISPVVFSCCYKPTTTNGDTICYLMRMTVQPEASTHKNADTTWVWLPAATLLGNDLRQLAHTHVPLLPSSINWYRSERGDAVWLGRQP